MAWIGEPPNCELSCAFGTMGSSQAAACLVAAAADQAQGALQAGKKYLVAASHHFFFESLATFSATSPRFLAFSRGFCGPRQAAWDIFISVMIVYSASPAHFWQLRLWQIQIDLRKSFDSGAS